MDAYGGESETVQNSVSGEKKQELFTKFTQSIMKGKKKEEFDYQSIGEQALKAMYRASH